jgi:conjugative transfer signal peptidase TraF
MAVAAEPYAVTRFGAVMTTYFAVLATGLSALFHPSPRLLWNASASVPVGLYRIRPVGTPHIGELVVAMPPEPLASYLAARGYLPEGVPLLKYVFALAGQTVCRADDTITIDGATVGRALSNDWRGRKLPTWQGCQVLPNGSVFLMNVESEHSLDGRYFGPIAASAIVGRAVSLWIPRR